MKRIICQVIVPAIAAFLLPALFLCSGKKQVVLDADFGARPEWAYAMDVRINGSFSHDDTTENFANTARCLLRGTAAAGKPGSLRFKLTDVAIASTVIDSAEILNLRQQFEGTELVYSGSAGEIETADPVNLPAVHIGGWDLYHTMARVVPALPRNPIVPGSVWERERQIPLTSIAGNGTGHLYQSFVLDSIVSIQSDLIACISWKFSYRVSFTEKPATPVANDIPLMGSGTGSARFNCTAKRLEEARISFKVEKSRQSLATMEWSEQAALVLQ